MNNQLLNLIEQITPTRNLNLFYIIIDTIFLLFLSFLLLYKKRYQTFSFGIFGGILYLIVDYGGFYLLSHSRVILINNEVATSFQTFLIPVFRF